jgi:tight adherence protein B
MRSLILILLTVGGFFAVFLFVVSSFSAVRKKIRYGRERLNRYLTVIAVSRRLRTQLGQVKTKKRKRRIPFSNLFEALVTRRETSKRLESDLLQANIPLKPGEFLALQAVFIILFTVLFWFIFDFTLAIAVFFVCLLVPGFWIRARKRSRINRFNLQLTDTLITMANSLRSGYSFFQAMELVAQEGQSPMKEEFARTLKEVNIGLSLEEAFGHLLERIESSDLELIVTAVLIQRQVGGNLAEVLEKISSTIRERVRLQGEIRVLTAQGRLSGLIVSLLPVALALFIQATNPEYLAVMFTDRLGILMLFFGVISQIIGIMLIRSIVRIDV